MAKSEFLTVFLVLVLITSVAAIVGEVYTPSEADQKYDLTCKITITNTPLADARISDMQCNTKKASWFSLYDWVYDEGNLKLSAQGKSASVFYRVSEYGGVNGVLPFIPKPGETTKTLTIKKLEPGLTTANAILYDDTGNEIHFKTVSVNIGG